MSAPKFAFGDVVWMKGTKYKVTIISEPEYVLKGQFVQGTIERAFAKYEGWWYRHSGEVDSTFLHIQLARSRNHLTPRISSLF